MSNAKQRRFVMPTSGAARAAGKVDPDALAAFTAGADAPPAGLKPWEGKDDTRRVENFLLRLTAYEMAKLRHIAATSPDSMQKFCTRAVRNALDSLD